MKKRSERYIGVDWDSGDWIAVISSETEIMEARSYKNMEDLYREYEAHAERILVDIPIGLCNPSKTDEHGTEEKTSRRCDDLIDALALAVTAAAAVEELRTLPPEPPVDEMGLPMQMVYRSKEPFKDNVNTR